MYEYFRRLTKFQDSRVFVDEEAGLVVCIIYTELGKFEGRAKCYFGKDEFDAVIGKRIAYRRAARQANAYARDYIRDKYLVPSQKAYNKLQEIMNKHQEQIEEIYKDLN